MATVICVAMMMCNFLAAGPSIAMLDITMDFFPGAHPGRNPRLFAASVAKVSYFFTTTALLQGVGNFIWVPIANKYGRRPTYVFSYLIYFVTAIWLSFEHSYGGFLAGRILMGFGAGAAETVGKSTLAFFCQRRNSLTSFCSTHHDSRHLLPARAGRHHVLLQLLSGRGRGPGADHLGPHHDPQQCKHQMESFSPFRAISGVKRLLRLPRQRSRVPKQEQN